MKNKVGYDIYKLGSRLGLNKKDLDLVLRNQAYIQNQSSYSMNSGPYEPPYWASFYGTTSIEDF